MTLSDSEDSDDSGFGFDEGFSSDELLLGRIAQMRSMMNLTAAATAPTPTPTPVKPTPVKTTPVVPTGQLHNLQLKPQEEKESVVVPAAKDTETEELAEKKEEIEELQQVADSVHELSLSGRSSHKETNEDDDAVHVAPPPPAYYELQEQVEEEEEEEQEEEEEDEEEEEEEEEEEDDGYTVTWSRGQLGLLFKANAHGHAVIRRVNRKSSSAEGLHFARVGDVLTALNGESVRSRSFQEIVDTLRLPDFPLTLYFQPAQLSDHDDGDNIANGAMANAHPSNGPGHGTMDRKESSVSITSSSTSTVHLSAAPGPNSYSTTAHRLNQLAQNSNYDINGRGSVAPPVPLPFPPPAYSDSPRSSFDDSPLPDEYDVVWSQGSLGCGLKQRDGLPTIKSVTPGAAMDPSVQQIAPGDVMVRINGMISEQIGFRAVIETMQRAAKPIYMRFRRAGAAPAAPRGGAPPRVAPPVVELPLSRPSMSREVENLRESRVEADDDLLAAQQALQETVQQYTVLWSEGSLGVQIKARSSDGAVVISRLTGTGDPVLLADVSVGDVFVRIAGVEVAHLGIGGTYELLQSVQKPVVLVFERGGAAQAPVAPPPAPLAFEEPDDAVVPSFRELRERQAAAAAASAGQSDQYVRGSFGGFTPEQRGDQVFGAAGRRAVHARMRPSSYATFGGGGGGGGGSIDERHSADASPGRYSLAKRVDVDSDDMDRGSTDDASSERIVRESEEEIRPLLPRFSDIVMGRVHTSTVSSLPPPPAYLDVFSHSGRVVDKNQPQQQQQGSPAPSGGGPPGYAYPPPSPDRYRDAVPPPPPQPVLDASMMPYMQPPPSYDQHLGSARSNQRIDRLREQYIQNERKRNTQQPSREPSPSQFSSYSDLDDSRVMAAFHHQQHQQQHHRPPPSPGLPPPPLPPPSYASPPTQQHQQPQQQQQTPELWIQWNNGPLGITFRRTNGQIVVSRLTGAGYSPGIEQLRPGDWLVSFGNPRVGSYATNQLRLSETMELIKTLPKPLDMRFIVR